MNVKGKFKTSQEVREIKDGTFARNFVVMIDNGRFPEMPILFNIVGKQPRMALIDGFEEGDEVDVEFELKGRMSQNDDKKYFNNLSVKFITKL
jgi:hypothetical protein